MGQGFRSCIRPASSLTRHECCDLIPGGFLDLNTHQRLGSIAVLHRSDDVFATPISPPSSRGTILPGARAVAVGPTLDARAV